MKTKFLTALVAGACLFTVGAAHALTVTPDWAPKWTTTVTNNLDVKEPNLISEAFGVDTTDWALLYKAAFGSTTEESGSFAASYSTVFGEFAEASKSPSGATITFNGGSAIACPACFLIVKDGNHNPAQYLFDLGKEWDGIESLVISGFWPGSEGGSISNIAIWGFEDDDTTAGDVPEPGSLALLGLGLAGLAALRRRWS